ncbi:MAG: tRNA glutamyl-Q(34) synthetase GluQRS [Acidithiobacillus sp.]
MSLSSPVIGRFAPSPSGPLHAGSLIAAIGSYLSARSQGGRWLLRMENIDESRTRPGAAERILRQTEALGLDWDGPVWIQSTRKERYQDALTLLIAAQEAYPCGCTRQEIRRAGNHYPGTCRAGLRPGRPARSWRLRLPETLDAWADRFLGPQVSTEMSGDPILLRADGYFAYLLACVVDDAEQGVTEVLRGQDLLSLTAIQRYLQQILGYPHPSYGHLPLLYNAEGHKLSKSTDSPAWSSDPGLAWEATLRYLGWATPQFLHGAPAVSWRDWALAQLRAGGSVYSGQVLPLALPSEA